MTGRYWYTADAEPEIKPWKGKIVTGEVVEHHVCPYTTGAIYLQPLAHAKISSLMDRFDKEWLAYLMGYWDGPRVIVEDIVVPSQVSSAASIEGVEEDPPEGKVGVIHSHVKMGAFFSNTDDEFINNNHDVSIVVSSKGQVLSWKSQVRKVVNCGVTMLMEWPVLTAVAPEITEWLDGCAAKVKDIPPPPPIVIQSPWLAKKSLAISDKRERDRFNKLNRLLDSISETTSTPALKQAFDRVFPKSGGNRLKEASTSDVLWVIEYMERFPMLDKVDHKYSDAWNEALRRLPGLNKEESDVSV